MSAHRAAATVASPSAASDRQHLLLAAGHQPGLLVAPLGKFRKKPEDLLEIGVEAIAIGTLKRTHPEVLDNRELGEDLPSLGNQNDPGPNAVGRGESVDRSRLEPDRAARAGLETDQGS